MIFRLAAGKLAGKCLSRNGNSVEYVSRIRSPGTDKYKLVQLESKTLPDQKYFPVTRVENLIEYSYFFTWHCTEVRFDSFLSGGFTTMVVINPPDWKLANRTSVQWVETE